MARSNAKKTTPVQASEAPASEAPASEVQASEVQASEVQASEAPASEVQASEPTVIPFTLPDMVPEQVYRVPLSVIRLNPDNIRTFNPEGDARDAELLRTVRATQGELITPITVRRESDGTLTAIRGNGRAASLMIMAAAGEAIPHVRVMLHPDQSPIETLYDQQVSNNGRTLTPIQQGRLYQALKDKGESIANISAHVGKSDRTVENYLHLATAPSEIDAMLTAKRVSDTLTFEVWQNTGGAVHGWAKAASILKEADAKWPKTDASGKVVRITADTLDKLGLYLNPREAARREAAKKAAEDASKVKDAEDAAKKTEGTTPPASGTTPPASGTTPPASGTTPPASGTTPPASGTTPPASGTTPPASGTGAKGTPPVAPSEPRMILCYEAEGTNVFHIRNTGKREASAHCVANNPGNAQRIALALNYFVSFGPDAGYRPVKK